LHNYLLIFLQVNTKSSLLTLPTELVEQVATFLSHEDLQAIRLTNSILARKSFRPFASIHFNSIQWARKNHLSHQWSKTTKYLLAERPEFAPYVKNVSIEFMTDPWKVGNLPNPDLYISSLLLFTNIHHLQLNNCSPHLMSSGFEEFGHRLYLPYLETLVVSDARSFGEDAITRFIATMLHRHRSTLTTVELLHISTENYRDWPHILDTASCLSDNAAIHICAPKVRKNHYHISFVPDSTSVDADSVKSLQGPVATSGGPYGLTYHYFSMPGKLKAALTCMARCYRVARSFEEALLFNGDMAQTDLRYGAVFEEWVAFACFDRARW
jgi:hypothetical protein